MGLGYFSGSCGWRREFYYSETTHGAGMRVRHKRLNNRDLESVSRILCEPQRLTAVIIIRGKVSELLGQFFELYVINLL